MGRSRRYVQEVTGVACLCSAFAWLSLASSCLAQDAPPRSAGNSEASQRAAEWNALASTLEQRLARLLPCDERVQFSIDEVARASDLRIAAQVAERQALSFKSQEQITALTQLLAVHEALFEKWKSAESVAKQEQTEVQAQAAILADLATQSPQLNAAARSLDGLARTTQDAVESVTRNQTESANLSTSMKDWILAAQARQEKIELYLKALADEGQNWRAYYVARSARAKVECSITNPGTDPGATPTKRPRRSSKSKKAK